MSYAEQLDDANLALLKLIEREKVVWHEDLTSYRGHFGVSDLKSTTPSERGGRMAYLRDMCGFVRVEGEDCNPWYGLTARGKRYLKCAALLIPFRPEIIPNRSYKIMPEAP